MEGHDRKIRLGLVGTGNLGRIVAGAWKDGFLEDYELVGIAGRDEEKAGKLARQVGCPFGGSYEGLMEQKPEMIAEAASIAFVKEHVEEILKSGCSIAVLSIGAFADRALYDRAAAAAREHGTRVYISSGVVGGFDILRTMRLLGEVRAEFSTHKGPESLRNTPLFDEELLEDGEKTRVYQGTTGDIIKILPTKVNVAVASSLAASSPEKTRMEMFSVPGMVGDDHRMAAEVEGARAVIDIYTESGTIAAWGLVSTLRNITAPIVF